MSTRSKDIIFLLGAGASAEAGIPTSGQMVSQIETLLLNDDEWKQSLDLYHHIKSAIHYAAGLKGLFNNAVPYNIETLVNTLYELERNEEHPLYPFIASWNSRIIALAGSDFSKVKQFRTLILRKLKNWVSPDDTSLGDYYRGFAELQRDLNFPLRIFSLNYDLCVERLNSPDFRVETGFAGIGPKHPWDWERFEDSDTGPASPQVYLYKLHGSINWKRHEATQDLFLVEQTEGIEPGKMEVIFGRDFKLEAADPYLFYVYEFRKFSLLTRLIISLGYGFGDFHINKMLAQALRDDLNRRLLIIMNSNDDDVRRRKQKEITKELGVGEAQVIVNNGTAKEFLETQNLKNELVALIPKAPDDPF
jgi:hypothetical protein